MPTNHPARIFFILSKESNKAVIFRRGPTKWTQMSIWNFNDDSIEFGQWSKINLRPRRCDLSPSGDYLIYLNDQGEEKDSFTAICKPPFWTTLCKWKHNQPIFGSGGGLFKSNTELELNYFTDSNSDFEGNIPSGLNVSLLSDNCTADYDLWKGHINPLLEIRLKRNGWTEIEDNEFIGKETSSMVDRIPSKYWDENFPESKNPMKPKLFEKKITNNSFLWMITYYHSYYKKMLDTFYVKRRSVRTKLDYIVWADVDYKGRIIGTKNGQLYASKRYKDGSIQLTNLELLHDLNSQIPAKTSNTNEIKK